MMPGGVAGAVRGVISRFARGGTSLFPGIRYGPRVRMMNAGDMPMSGGVVM